MVAVLLIAFFALLIFGTPIITALMGSSLLSFAMYSTKDLKAVAQAMFASNGSFSLLAIPLFVLAGALMSSGGISKRLIKFFDKLVGWMPGWHGYRSCIGLCIFWCAFRLSSCHGGSYWRHYDSCHDRKKL